MHLTTQKVYFTILHIVVMFKKCYIYTKNNQRFRLTKRLFHESLIRLLQKKPLYEITVSQLCSDSELNRSTFYKYYENVY